VRYCLQYPLSSYPIINRCPLMTHPPLRLQTGAGKTHTMLGGAGEARGVIPRAVETIFARAAFLAEQGWAARMTAEMVEIYNEDIRDLLSVGASSGAGGMKHEIRHDKDGNTTVSDHHPSSRSARNRLTPPVSPRFLRSPTSPASQ
jgi:hypothetical protein